jgi:uncharacterized protein YdeI (YjbR/CyaY-like superfamily)
VDEAICFGWIDGVRRSRDEESYTVRFTPRKAASTWSKVNIAKAEAAIAAGRMTEAGRRAFAARKGERSGVYSFEQNEIKLPAAALKAMKADAAAWAFWQNQPNWYRKAATWWVISAKQEKTKASRLATLVADCAAGQTINPLTRPAKAKKSKQARRP